MSDKQENPLTPTEIPVTPPPPEDVLPCPPAPKRKRHHDDEEVDLDDLEGCDVSKIKKIGEARKMIRDLRLLVIKIRGEMSDMAIEADKATQAEVMAAINGRILIEEQMAFEHRKMTAERDRLQEQVRGMIEGSADLHRADSSLRVLQIKYDALLKEVESMARSTSSIGHKVTSPGAEGHPRTSGKARAYSSKGLPVPSRDS